MEKRKRGEGEKWTCEICTYVNLGNTSVCLMCSSERRKIQHEDHARGEATDDDDDDDDDEEGEEGDQQHQHPAPARSVQWEEPWGDRRNELVVIGQDMDHDAMRAALEACLMTDDEMSTYETVYRGATAPWLANEQDKLEQEEAMLRRILPIMQDRHGAENPMVAGTMSKLGGVLQDQDKLDEAEVFFLKALEIFEREHGPTRVQTLGVLNSLALVRQEQGRLEEAEAMYRRVLASDETMDEKNVAITTTNLARALKDLGKLGEAKEQFLRALEMTEANPEAFPDDFTLYARGSVTGIFLLQSEQKRKRDSGDGQAATDAAEAREALQMVVALMTGPPLSLPDTDNQVKRLREFLE